ncbi:MAG: hypothetical protein RIR94_430, partial [Bacteroidota bacterium]|jgi:hypothetical protein
LPTGTYEVLVHDARPCYDTLVFEITEPEVLVSNYVLQSVSCTGLSDGQINASATGGNGGYTYQVGSLVNASGVFDNMSAGSYIMTTIDSLGCAAVGQTIQISQPAPLSLSISATNATSSTAFDGMATAIVIGGTAPYQYVWSDPNAQTDSMAVYLTEGWYMVVVTDANGCSIQDSVFMDVLGIQHLPNSSLLIFPNPTQGRLYFSMELNEVAVLDMQGRVLCVQRNCLQLDLTHLAAGQYQVICTHSEGTELLRFVKE